MSTNRIDPVAVARWFRDHPEIRPLQKRYTDCGIHNGLPTRCCGLVAAAYAAGMSLDRAYHYAEFLELPGEYIDGFCGGWDEGKAPLPSWAQECRNGYVDGKKALELTRILIKEPA